MRQQCPDRPGRCGPADRRGRRRLSERRHGDDIYYVSDRTHYAYEYIGEGTDLVFASVSHTLRGNVENLALTGISGNTYVQGDTNGDGAADFWIRLDGLQVLTASDLVL